MATADEAEAALDEAIVRLATTASADDVLTLVNAWDKLHTDPNGGSDEEEPKPIHATQPIEFADVGTSFWSEDKLRPGFRPGGYDGTRRLP